MEVTLMLLLVGIGWFYVRSIRPLSKLPGPWYTKWTDIILTYQIVKGQKATFVDRLHQEYGCVVRLSPCEASLRDPSAAQHIYQTKGEFPKAQWYTDLGSLESIFTTRNVELHRRYRRLLSSGVSETGLKIHIPTIETNIRLAILRMDEEMEKRGVADVLRWFLCMATDIVGELSFGESFRMLQTGERNQYLSDLEATAAAAGIRSTFPTLTKLAHYVPIPAVTEAIKVRNRIIHYAEDSLRKHYSLVKEQGEQAKPTLLSKLYKAGEEGLEFHELSGNAVEYIIAGSDTTANTLTYLIWQVCKHPRVLDKLTTELETLRDGFDYNDVKGLPYLNSVIDETMRMHSAVPGGLPREVPRGGVKFNGYFMPGGTTVSAQAYSMHRNPAVFTNPLVFDPSRWTYPTKAMKDSFVPFGGGSRICIGMYLARMELRLATAFFFKKFPNAKVSARESFGDDDMEPEMFFLLSPKNHRCLIELR